MTKSNLLALISALSIAILGSSFVQGSTPTCPAQSGGHPSSEANRVVWNGCQALARQNKDEIDFDRLPPGSVKALLWSATRCLQSVGDSAIGLVSGLKDLAKMVVIDLPKAAFDETKETIGWLWNSAVSFFGGSSDAAHANANAYRSPLQRARERAENFKKLLFEVLPEALRNSWAEFSCLPAPLQAKAICKIEMDIFLALLPAEGVVGGSEWLQRARALTEAKLATLRTVPEFKIAGDIARKLDAVAGKYASRGWKILETELSVPGRFKLFSAENQAENKFLIFERMVKNPTTKKEVWIADKLGKDAATGALDGRTEIGREFMQTLVETSKPEKQAVLFLDVNHLGKVNYFPGGAQAGDTYLKAVARAAQDAVRNMGHVFRHGGDELTVHLAETTPQKVKAIEQNIIDAVHRDPEVRKIFQKAKKEAGEFVQQIRNAHSKAELPESLMKRGSDSKKSFEVLKQELLAEQIRTLKELASIQPSVSVGGAMVRKGESAEAAIARADLQAAKMKTAYKQKIGADTTKYGGTAGSTTQRNLKAKPEAALPDL